MTSWVVFLLSWNQKLMPIGCFVITWSTSRVISWRVTCFEKSVSRQWRHCHYTHCIYVIDDVIIIYSLVPLPSLQLFLIFLLFWKIISSIFNISDELSVILCSKFALFTFSFNHCNEIDDKFYHVESESMNLIHSYFHPILNAAASLFLPTL